MSVGIGSSALINLSESLVNKIFSNCLRNADWSLLVY